MRWFKFFLAKKPVVYKIVHECLRAAVGDDSLIRDVDKYHAMPANASGFKDIMIKFRAESSATAFVDSERRMQTK